LSPGVQDQPQQHSKNLSRRRKRKRRKEEEEKNFIHVFFPRGDE
jgi:hypothetical protein